ncbi:MAG: RelA/SpoT family protein [Candidatus Nanoarchaeia archaeon]
MKSTKTTITTHAQVDDIAREFIESLPKQFSKQLIYKAYEFAKRAHQVQYRKTGDLYITHPLEVAKLSFHYGLGPQSICAALLHDTVEDTSTTLETLSSQFGPEITMLVDGLTKIEQQETRRKTDIEKNITELRKMLLSASKDMRILIIKLCDRLHNMQTLYSRGVESQKRIAKETLYIYAPIAQKIGIYSIKWELEDLSFKYLYPSEFEMIKQKLGIKKETRLQILQQAINEIQDFLHQQNISNVSVLGRCKSIYSIYRKIAKKKVQFEDIYDLYAIRVITRDISSCYELLSLFNSHYTTYSKREKDYILHPKENGYQSLHIVIHSHIINHPVEIQIRDVSMHKLAEYGIAAHWKYKDIGRDKLFDKRITWLRELLQWEQENNESYNMMQILKYDLFDNEIFVLTPKYDIIALPQGAKAIDFAYYIHTQVGNTASKCKINGAICNLDKTIQNGDIVEIITNPKAKANEKMLQIATTNKAKLSIRQSLGLKLPNKRTIETGETSFSEIIQLIEGLKSYSKVKNPLCCTFCVKDDIVGIESQNGKEITIHKTSCKNAKYSLQRKIKLLWSEELYNTTHLELYLQSHSGILIDLLDILKKEQLTPLRLKNRINKDGSVFMRLKIAKTKNLNSLISKIRNIKGVDGVREVETHA